MSKTAIFGLVFVLTACSAAILLDRPPAPVAASAPPTEFSAERATVYLENFAWRPHPIGTGEHDRVRDYLAAELTKLGVTPGIQRTTGVTPRYQVAGSVENIVARLKGTSGSSDAVLLAAHYDSVPSGPGAADDGAGVAAILEALRALRAGPILRNDLILLLTDGEEDGLLGASAFMAEHPWAKDVRVAVNFEARGNAGASQMFETSAQNGRLIELYANALPHPHGTSLTYEIYQHMPNDTDMTVFKKYGAPGLNFAFIGHWEAYHTPLDNPQNLSRRSLQQHGDYALALARSLGNADLSQLRAPDTVYFGVPGGWFVHYSAAQIWRFTILAAVVFIAIYFYASGASQTGVWGIVLGLLVNLILAALLAATAWGFMKGINWLHSRLLPEGDVVQSASYGVSLVALLVLLWVAVCYLLLKKMSPASLFLGGAFVLLLLEIAAAKWLPGGTYVLLWPLIALLVATPIGASQTEKPSLGAVLALGLLSLPAVLIFVPPARGTYEALGLTSMGAPALALFLALFFMALAPLLDAVRKILPLTALAVALAAFVSGASMTHYSAKHPKPSALLYTLDADTGKAVWASNAARADNWTAQFVGSTPTRARLEGVIPDWITWEFLQHDAPTFPLPPPTAEVLENSTTGDSRTLRLHIASPRRARTLAVETPENEILDSWANGKLLGRPSEARFNRSGKWNLVYANLPAEGIELKLIVRGSGPVRLHVLDRSIGLPEISGVKFAARPPDSMPQHGGDETIVRRTFVF